MDAARALSVLTGVAKVVAEGDGLDDIFGRVADAADRLIGHSLFTVMAFDAGAMTVRRLYSTDPRAYPLGGMKKKRDTAWGRAVLEEGRPFIGNSADDIRANFNDHETILGLGLTSVLNMPIRSCGRTLGTMNLLDTSPHYGPEDLGGSRVLAGQLVGPLLLQHPDDTAR